MDFMKSGSVSCLFFLEPIMLWRTSSPFFEDLKNNLRIILESKYILLIFMARPFKQINIRIEMTVDYVMTVISLVSLIWVKEKVSLILKFDSIKTFNLSLVQVFPLSRETHLPSHLPPALVDLMDADAELDLAPLKFKLCLTSMNFWTLNFSNPKRSFVD